MSDMCLRFLHPGVGPLSEQTFAKLFGRFGHEAYLTRFSDFFTAELVHCLSRLLRDCSVKC